MSILPELSRGRCSPGVLALGAVAMFAASAAVAAAEYAIAANLLQF